MKKFVRDTAAGVYETAKPSVLTAIAAGLFLVVSAMSIAVENSNEPMRNFDRLAEAVPMSQLIPLQEKKEHPTPKRKPPVDVIAEIIAKTERSK